MQKTIALAGALLFGMSINGNIAHAQATAGSSELTTENLYENCKSSEQAVISSCDDFIRGIRDLMEVTGLAVIDKKTPPEQSGAMWNFAACNVPETTEVRKAFIGWVDKGPNYRRYPAAMSVWIVVSQNWPCPIKVPVQPPH